MRTQRLGWDMQTDFSILFSSRVITECTPVSLIREQWYSPSVLGRLTIPALLLTFGAILALELAILRRPGSGWRERLPYYVCAAALFVIPAANTCRYTGMLRYSLPVAVLLVLMAAHLRAQQFLPRPRALRRPLLYGCSAIALALNFLLEVRYLRGWWVS